MKSIKIFNSLFDRYTSIIKKFLILESFFLIATLFQRKIEHSSMEIIEPHTFRWLCNIEIYWNLIFS